MASTKVQTVIETSLSLSAGGGDDTSATVNLVDGYGATLLVKLTNGGTGPTLPAEVQVRLSTDDSEWYDYGGPMIGGVTANQVVSWAIEIPASAMYLQLISGSNTGQAVTQESTISEITEIS